LGRRNAPASFKDIVNEVLRRGLGAQEPVAGKTAPFRVDTFRSGFRAGVDPLRLNQLVDDVEVRDHTERPA